MGERVNEAKGRLKAGLGAATGNRDLQAEGEAQAGTARGARKAKGALEEIGGRLQQAAGTIAGDSTTEAKGSRRRASGKLRQTG